MQKPVRHQSELKQQQMLQPLHVATQGSAVQIQPVDQHGPAMQKQPVQQQTYVTQNEHVQQQHSVMQQQPVQQHVIQNQLLQEDPPQTEQLVQSNRLLQGQQRAQDIEPAPTVLHPTAASAAEQASALVSPHLLSLISAQLHACGCLAVWCLDDATRCFYDMSCLMGAANMHVLHTIAS